MVWKIYFFGYLVLNLLEPLVLPEEFADPTIKLYAAFVITICGFIGLYGYSWKKRILRRFVWKWYWTSSLIWMIMAQFFGFSSSPHLVEGIRSHPIRFLVVVTIELIATIPAIVAVFLYAFRSRDIWEQKLAAEPSDN